MITNKELILKSSLQSKNEVLDLISKKLVDKGFAKSKKEVLNGFKAREKDFTTGLSNGVAIPHVSSKSILETKIVIVKLNRKINWKSLDGKLIDFVIAIAVPASGRNEHFELLTALSEKLSNPLFLKEFKKYSNDKIVDVVNNLKIKKQKIKQTNKKDNKIIKVVGVTTCVTGVAHTFLAAQSLEDEGQKRGWDIKIERQGQMTKNKLTQNEIDNADYVIIGQSKSIDGQERFNNKLVYSVEVAKPITKAKEVLDDLLIKSKIQSPSGSSKVKAKNSNDSQKQGILSHLMAGISFMIPYIAMAGITLGLTTAFGFSFFNGTPAHYINDGATLVPAIGNLNWAGQNGFASKSPFWEGLSTLAGQGFTLYIPILAMFIANSIAGRKAMAPAAILALVLNIGPQGPKDFAPFFNYETLNFIGWNNTPALGFLGAVVSGYIIGGGIHFFTKLTDKVESHAFQSVLPLLIIPILFTFIPWIFMAFIGYLPLYYLAMGLNWIVTSLYKINMLWLAGGIMGTMICFDLGGPINKIAMAIGVMMLGNHDESSILNGVAATAVSIPAVTLFFSWIFSRFTPLNMDAQDKTAASAASLMGFFGITEGAIPFAAKNPKKWMPSFMIAGFVGGALASFTGVIDNVAMWGGPIIYIAGGYSSLFNNPLGLEISQVTQIANWTWTLLYFIPLVIGGLVGFIVASILEWFYQNKGKHKNKI